MAIHRSPVASVHGFTLVEMSIVIAIFGLLVGGILGGQAIIRASQLRSVVAQHTSFLNATTAFQDKYDYLPGDLPNAVSYWGLAGGVSGDDAACASTASNGTATCNGDGDGKIRTEIQGPEPTRFWQHLSNAGMIEGRYTGTGVAALKQNSPQSRLPNGLWIVADLLSTPGNTNLFAGTYRNSFLLGGVMDASRMPNGVIMETDELASIDRKMDDGKPATGKITIRSHTKLTDCTDAGGVADLTASYTSNSLNEGCILVFREQF